MCVYVYVCVCVCVCVCVHVIFSSEKGLTEEKTGLEFG